MSEVLPLIGLCLDVAHNMGDGVKGLVEKGEWNGIDLMERDSNVDHAICPVSFLPLVHVLPIPSTNRISVAIPGL